MDPVLLIDFGSTYTKLTAADADERVILATAQSYTTVEEDVSIGFQKALKQLSDLTGPIEYRAKLACSSAAGGLRMVACGLVPGLTAKAARFAAFGAGAKVIKTYAYQLTQDDIHEIEQSKPDILLLVGGTDGGNTDVVCHNAQAIAQVAGDFPVVYAGNRSAASACEQLLRESSHKVHIAPNVMPSLGKLDVGPAQRVIRDIFLERIVRAKGLSGYGDLLDGILMPTPSAVLEALTLLSVGLPDKDGLGDLVAADLGGATTDIYSIATGDPVDPCIGLHGLREPRVKRTVEGDIGMRYSARGVLQAAGIEELCSTSGLDEASCMEFMESIERDPSVLPQNEQQDDFDKALAVQAIRLGLTRHAGTLEEVYSPAGLLYRQTGKDLTRVKRVILTGGALIHAKDAEAIVRQSVQVRDQSALIPREFEVTVDRQYILSAMGLLAGYNREAAFDIMTKHFKRGNMYAAD